MTPLTPADSILNKALKLMPQKMKMTLLNVINACFQMTYFATKWKKAIISFPKPQKNHEWPENHRQINLVQHIFKIVKKNNSTKIKK